MNLSKNLKIDKENLLYTDRALWALFIPIIIEQFLNFFMGMIDTVMVSNVGPIAVSAVSLVDSVNNLVVQIFAALAAGATIVCSQYLGMQNKKKANEAARQIFLSVLVISSAITVFCIVFKRPLLALIFGSVDSRIMDDAVVYFFITALSYPFLALSNAGAALFRAGGNSRFPLWVSTFSNLLNIILNAVMIFSMGMGVAGAALGTLIARIINMLVLFAALYRDRQPIALNHYLTIRPDFPLIWIILSIGIPAGIENGMFQFGKLVIQSTVSTLGTTAMAAQAIAIVLELLSGIGGLGVAMGLMTVIGQAVGAGRKDETIYYMRKGILFSFIGLTVTNLLVFVMTWPLTILAGMEADSARLCFEITFFMTIAKELFWVPSFLLSYGMRSAGDIQFSMIVSTCTMWLCRVVLSILLIRGFGMGLVAVWIGMATDWAVRGVIFIFRYRSGKWMLKSVV